MLEFGSLESVTAEEIVDAFNDAFAEYELPVQMTVAKFEFMNRERSVRLEHSFGLFDSGALVGFILNGSREWDGVLTAYDSATGIRRSYQGGGNGTRLLRESVDTLRDLGYRRYLLEVLLSNEPAASVYRNLGFETVRTLHCYRKGLTEIRGRPEDVVESPVEPGWSEGLSRLLRYLPSWQNWSESAEAIAESCSLISTWKEGEAAAFTVLIRPYGNLMQIGWTDEEALESVIAYASYATAAQELTVINLPDSESETERALAACGFVRFTSQYEMALSLD